MPNNKKSMENIFVSKVRIKALNYFCANPLTPIHLRGAVRELSEEINAVRRELGRLEDAGIILSESKGNRKYFRLNLEHMLVSDLISMVNKTFGLGGEIVKNINVLGDVQFALITPSYSRGHNYGTQIVDFMIIGDINMDELGKIIDKIEKSSGREIHYTVLKKNEFEVRKRRRDQFLMDVMVQDNIMLVGKNEDFSS